MVFEPLKGGLYLRAGKFELLIHRQRWWRPGRYPGERVWWILGHEVVLATQPKWSLGRG